MLERIRRIADEIAPKIIHYRRDFHRHAECGWTEFRTASLVARQLVALGWEVKVGRDVVRAQDRMGVPATEELERCWQRALEQGGDPEFLTLMRGGFTGVVGILRNGEGPTVGLRFDMDALPIQESHSSSHHPALEGFASVNEGVMHACGHDAHTAIGLGVAEILASLKQDLRGEVRLIFQPAEEGVRGAKSMVSAGVVEGVDILSGLHVMSGWAPGEIVSGMGDYAATEKFDVIFKGAPAHAGGSPEKGKNALLAAATAVLNLYAIPRHGDGRTRINVGTLRAGGGRNVICPLAHLVVETRGANNKISAYMYDSAKRVIEAAGAMYDCEVTVKGMGSAPTAKSDPALAKRIERIAGELGSFSCYPPSASGGSEDFTYMMLRVQEQGGLAAYIGLGADFHGISHEAKTGREQVLGAHTPVFDIDEAALKDGMKLLAVLVLV